MLFAVVNAFLNAALSVDTPGTFAVPRSTPFANSAASAFAAAVDLSISLVRLLMPSINDRFTPNHHQPVDLGGPSIKIVALPGLVNIYGDIERKALVFTQG